MPVLQCVSATRYGYLVALSHAQLVPSSSGTLKRIAWSSTASWILAHAFMSQFVHGSIFIHIILSVVINYFGLQLATTICLYPCWLFQDEIVRSGRSVLRKGSNQSLPLPEFVYCSVVVAFAAKAAAALSRFAVRVGRSHCKLPDISFQRQTQQQPEQFNNSNYDVRNVLDATNAIAFCCIAYFPPVVMFDRY